MSVTVTFTISSLNAGTQVKYSSAYSRTPAESFANADANGLVTLTLGNTVNITYLIILPDGQFGRLAVRTTDSTIALGTIPVYPQGVPPGLEDITSLFSAATGGGTGDLLAANNLSDVTSKPISLANLMSLTSTATSGLTTTFTSASTFYQQFTGSSAHTITLPVTSTLSTGRSFFIINNSSGALTVNSSGGNAVATIGAGSNLLVTCILITGTSAASWEPTSFPLLSSIITQTITNGVTTSAPSEDAVFDALVLKTALARTTVVSAAATVSPTAGDSGTYYRLSNASPTLNLPASAGCTVGTTVFYVEGIGGTCAVVPNGGDIIERVLWSAGDPSFAGVSANSAVSLTQYAYGELRYVATGNWVLVGTFAV